MTYEGAELGTVLNGIVSNQEKLTGIVQRHAELLRAIGEGFKRIEKLEKEVMALRIERNTQ